MSEGSDSKCGWLKAYHKSGLLVTLPVPSFDSTGLPDYRLAHACVDAILTAGFLVTAPGLEAGEQVEQIGFVVRRSKDNDDGSTTPIVDLYPNDPAMKFSILSVYLNRDDDVAAFEAASGLRINDLPLYIAANKIERGASRQTDKLVVAAPRPFGAVWKDNPKYNPDEKDAKLKKPKRLFVRWQDAGNSSTATDNGDPDAAKLKPLADALKADPDLVAFNNLLPLFRDFPKGSELRARAWNLMADHAKAVGWEWDKDAAMFFTVGGGF